MANALPTYPQFDCSSDGRAVRWRKWIKRLQTFFVAYDIDDNERKKALLLTFGGEDLNDIVDTFTDRQLQPGENDDVFSKLVDTITSHFNPQANAEYQKYIFRKCEQKSDNIDEFYSELRQLAATCDFANADSEIKSQLIAGYKAKKVREKGLSSPNMSLDDLLTFARTLQLTSQQAIEMHPEVNKLNTYKKSHRPQHNQKSSTAQQNQSVHNKCRNCGGEWPHKNRQQSCPAFGKRCNLCSKLNHFASQCLSADPKKNQSSKPSARYYNKHQYRHRNTNHIEGHSKDVRAINMDPNSSSEETEYIFMTNTSHNNLPHFTVGINGQPFEFLADSGATINIMSKAEYTRISPKPTLQPSTKKISPFGSQRSISVTGVFNATIKHKTSSIESTIYVVEQNEKSILSWTSCQNLNLLATVNNLEDNKYQAQYPSIFTGVGCLKDQKTKLHIDKDIQPVAQQYRRIPFHVRNDIEEQLRKDEDLGIIEKASGPTPWISPIVVVPKPKQPGKIRVCVDMRAANKAIRRERHATPTLDELKTLLTGAKVFSKLDLNQGYNQLELEEESRYITTFATHKGLYRYRRLFFGVNSASEIFQEVIRQSLSGLDGVVNVSDDILCFGTTQSKHDENLQKLFQRLQQKGLTLNGGKCIFNQTSIEFLGHIFGPNGITPSQDKLKTILELPAPTNRSEVRSLLGMMNFCGAHHIPNYATLTHDLRLLTKKNTPWSWTSQHATSLQKLKEALSTATTLAYFNPRKPSTIYTDGSPIGVSAVLTQENRIIQFASRPLTPTKQRYSQTEREALGITWACEYFHIYIFGAPFVVITDHKPLVSIFNNPRSSMSPRIERWAMRLQPYEFVVKYEPGMKNPADYLSRHPINQRSASREEKIAEEYVNYIAQTSTPKAMTLAEVADKTTKDPTLSTVINSITTNNWETGNTMIEKDTYRSLYSCQTELSLAVNNTVILKGNRIVLPSSLHNRAVTIAHSGHQGMVKTLSLLREKVWFRGMSSMVESTVKNCMLCQVSTPTSAREPLNMSPLPTAPWTELSADFGHLPNGKYILVVVDEYSRYPIVDVIESTSARSVIPRFDKIFAEFGLPESLKTDNGPPFNGTEFANYCHHMGIKHRKITPLWPRANAETERFMRSIKKVIKGSTTPNFKQSMNQYLLDYRTTPHSTTNIAPATLLFNRSLKTKLPQLPTTPNDSNLRNRDAAMKESMKQYADNKSYVKPSELKIGDPVLLKAHQPNKSDTPYEPKPLVISNKKGSMITAKRGQQLVTRNSSFFKKSPRYPSEGEHDNEDLEENFDESLPQSDPIDEIRPSPNLPQEVPARPSIRLRSRREIRKPKRFNDFIM